ncbi:MAG: hypothetical protein OXO53_11545 [Chloroflexota bacterium]|nr:hypothetical protein [Chloroflexota bacterium]
MFRASSLLRLPETVRHVSGSPPPSGATLHCWRNPPIDVRSRRASTAHPQSVSASRSFPSISTRITSLAPASGTVSCETRPFETPSIPPSSCGVSHGQSASMSSTRFHAGFSTTGSSWSGTFNGSSGMRMTDGGAGCASLLSRVSRPFLRVDASAVRRSTTLSRLGTSQMGALDEERTACRSSARKAGTSLRLNDFAPCRRRT